MAKQKFYVVWHGRKPGVYDNWEDCKTQVQRFSGAKFKSFDSRQIAEEAFKEGVNLPQSAPPVSSDDWDEVPWE